MRCGKDGNAVHATFYPPDFTHFRVLRLYIPSLWGMSRQDAPYPGAIPPVTASIERGRSANTGEERK